MPKYSERSQRRLSTCQPPLQRLFNSIIERFDCTILYGHRTPEEQQDLYALGRTRPGRIVTYKDGIEKLSDHNTFPSMAVDATPYPVRWGDTDRMHYFAGWVMQTAFDMNIDIQWGGDWNRNTEVDDERFVDLPHFALILP